MPRATKSVSKIVKPLRGGQITIPSEFRQKLGIKDDTLLQVILEGDELRLRKVQVKEAGEGSPWLMELYELFAPVREDLAGYSEEEVDATIDQAVRKVRRRKHA